MWTIFLNNFTDLLILGCAGSLLLLRRFFSSWGKVARGPRSSHRARAPRCGGAQTPGHSGFSSCGSHLQITGSRVAAHRPSCPVACGTVPSLEPEALSPARAGGLSTAQPPGKPSVVSRTVSLSFLTHSHLMDRCRGFAVRLTSLPCSWEQDRSKSDGRELAGAKSAKAKEVTAGNYLFQSTVESLVPSAE